MSAARHWTGHKLPDQELVHLYVECHFSSRDIAERYGISRSTVVRRLTLLGVKRRPRHQAKTRVSSREMAQMVFMYERLGWSCRQIGEHFGLRHHSVWYRLKNAGVALRPAGGTHVPPGGAHEIKRAA